MMSQSQMEKSFEEEVVISDIKQYRKVKEDET